MMRFGIFSFGMRIHREKPEFRIFFNLSLAESRWKSCTIQVFLCVRSTARHFKISKCYAYTQERNDKQTACGQELENSAGH